MASTKTLAADVTSAGIDSSMEEALDIGDVARETGLSLRALRFYEARGLIRPVRTAGGRRVYGPGELSRFALASQRKTCLDSLFAHHFSRKPEDHFSQ